jgi:hypothetical protein
VPRFHPQVLHGVPRTEHCPAADPFVGELLALGNVPVGEQGVLAPMPGA